MALGAPALVSEQFANIPMIDIINIAINYSPSLSHSSLISESPLYRPATINGISWPS